jgi:hypothetical protein
MRKKHGPPRTRPAELAQLTIKVSPGFRLKLKAYIETAEESAGAYLERMARRDLDERARKIASAWIGGAASAPADQAEAEPAAA